MPPLDARKLFFKNKLLSYFALKSEDPMVNSVDTALDNIIFESFLEGKKDNGSVMFVRKPSDSKIDLLPELTSEFEENQKIVYFIRKDDKPIPPKENQIFDVVLSGAMDEEAFKNLQILLQQVYIPVLEKNEDWGKSDKAQIVDFLNTVNTFSEKLSALSSQNVPKVELPKPAGEYSVKDTAEIRKARTNPEAIQHYTKLIKSWTTEISSVLGNNVNNDTEDPGPRSEINFWKTRLAKLSSLIEELKLPEIKGVLAVLQQAHSPSVANWFELDLQITDAFNEAKDNVKYLIAIEKYINVLYEGSSKEIIEIVPGLMKSIRMMFIISRHFNTKERITDLLKKITSQMIQNCRETIEEDGRLWDQDVKKLIVNLKDCIQLNSIYRKHFKIEKKKLEQAKNEKQFDFDMLELFGKFDLFCSRIETLEELFSTIHQFSELQKHKLDGGMDRIIQQFFSYVDELKRRSNDLLDYKKNAFDNDYLVFNKKVNDLEQSLQVIINTSFENISSSEVALDLLQKFQSIIQRPTLKAELENKYTVIFHNYGIQLNNVQKVYERNKANPPLVRNAPPVAGNIIWCRQLMRRIEEPMRKFRMIPAIMESKESRKIIKIYNKVMKLLFVFENLWINEWKNCIFKQKAGLEATLVVKHNESYYVNFDSEILKLIRETKWLMRLGVVVPPEATVVLLQEKKFTEHIEKLTFCLNEFKRITSSIPEELLPLLTPHLDELKKRIEPGAQLLTWRSMNIDPFLQSIHKGLEKFEDMLVKTTNIIEYRVKKNIALIERINLLNLEAENCFDVLLFVEIQEKNIKSHLEYMNIKNLEAEKAVDDVISIIKGYPLEKTQLKTADYLYSHFKDSAREKMQAALCNCAISSLNGLKRRLTEISSFLSKKESKPLFNSTIHLVVPNISLSPSVDDVHRVIQQTTKSVLGSFKSIKNWSTEVKHSFYDEIVKKTSIAKLVVVLEGSFYSLNNQVSQYIETFKRYSFLWTDDKVVQCEKFMKEHENHPSLEEFEKQLNYYLKIEKEIRLTGKDTAIIGALSVDVSRIMTDLETIAHDWKIQYAQILHDSAKEGLEGMVNDIEENGKKMQSEIKTLEGLRFAMEVLKSIRGKEATFDFNFTDLTEKYQILKKYEYEVPKEELDQVFDITYKWDKLTKVANNVNEKISSLQVGFKGELVRAVKEFKVDVMQFRNEFEANGPLVSGISPEEAMNRLKKYQRLYQERDMKMETYKAGEELFAFPSQDYPELLKTKKDLLGLEKLYTLYLQVLKKLKEYEDILWVDLDFQAITDEVENFKKAAKGLPKYVKEWDAFTQLNETIERFLELQPILERLSDKAIQPRHWEAVQDKCGKQFKKDDEVFKLKDIMEADILKFKDDIEDIGFSAVKEADIERKIGEIEAQWKDVELQFDNHGHRGPVVLKGGETAELMENLEDTQMTVGSIMSSRFVGPFRERVSKWMITLSAITDTLKEWVGVQATWMYLEAVFSGGDIAAQLPGAAKKFTMIDKTWIKIMQKATQLPNVLKFCYDNEMLKGLPYLKEQLEQCQKSLTGYLGNKRDLFPRFYFCSDPILLEILSQSSNPHSIQPHLSQIFDSVQTITFDQKIDNKILEMNSPEGETVKLQDPIVAKGNVEDWLKVLEKGMQETMKSIIRVASEEAISIDAQHIKAFVEKFPAQVALLGIQVLWTFAAQESIRKFKTDKNALANTKKDTEGVLSELITLTTQDLSKRDRIKIETLITIQVHQRDVYNDDVFGKKLKDSNDFSWQKQARFYWQQEKDDLVVSISDIDQDYCYEYLGCKERLVITPLTDRCYITLCQALGLKLGGAPAGPAGTGKTETVKDLGRSLGKYVVVFNCSDQMDFRAMGEIYKGLAQSGAWGDFDEFNRIQLEVLSVVAQQIQRILNAMRDDKKTFEFTDGSIIPLDNKTAIFITMNPGYQGRQELPENLKVLFRGVAMMVPDKRIIIGVKLAACGYKQIDTLATKFYVLYQLCEQQLSKQAHYDFGLRNILSVLRTAGSTKRQNPDKSERFLLCRTLRDMNLSKLVAEDVDLFNSLVNDLFPGENPPKRAFPELEGPIVKHVEDEMLLMHEPWKEKVVQLYETALVRHGIMVVGPAGAGKSSCYRILLKTLTDIDRPHKEFRMNPKAITAPQMFGKKDPIQNEWTDGIFSALWKEANKNKKSNIWIICDGPVDSIWIENLNTVLDDNKLLTLANGDRIPMAPSVKMCFEVENLNNASPATVSRAGQIFMSETVLGWQPVIMSKMRGYKKAGETVKPFTDPESKFITSLFNNHIDDGITFIRKNLKQVMSVPNQNQPVTLFNILTGLVAEFKAAGADVDNALLEKLFFFSYTWSVGAILEPGDQVQFSGWLVQRSKCFNQQIAQTSVYEWFVDKKTKAWRKWKEIVPEWEYPGDEKLDFSTLFIPTPETVRYEFIMDILSKQRLNVLAIGGSGTAKTVTMQHFLNRTLAEDEKMLAKKLNFSSATTPNIYQTTIENVIEKRFRSFGPPGGKHMIVFVDDINMPEINEWGDQVTNEIVRQLIEQGGVYSLAEPGEWTQIVDMHFVGAMSHPGGGKNDIPDRLKRQFNIMNITLPDKLSVDQIYGYIIRGRYNAERGTPEPITNVANSITEATIEFWKIVQGHYLPTPSKFHYIFNLRDLSRVYQGVTLCPYDIVKNAETLVKLWKHECTRVFSDRLIDVPDKIWFDEQINLITEKYFSADLANAAKSPTYFVNFLRDAPLDEETGEPLEDAPKIYEPIDVMDNLRKRLQSFMEEYNEQPKNRTKKLDLVLFDMAVKHIVRISRILAMPRGNALLVGVGGSGKQSLTRLASYIAGYQTRQIVLNKQYNTTNFFDDLKENYKISGGQGQPITFIFTDAHIKQEDFLEYINNILSSGEIAGLFLKDELDAIINDLRIVAKQEYPDTVGKNDTYDNLYKFFIDRVRDNFHIVLCFSPVGEKFRTRALRFPGLISGCTINWFFSWPKEALNSVANKFMAEYTIHCSPEVKVNLVDHMANVHLFMNEVAEKYFQRFRRRVFTTPKSYLSFISLYKEVYADKYEEIGTLAQKINSGLSKLQTAAEDVEKLKQQLKEKEVKLAIAQEETDKLLQEISVKTEYASNKEKEVKAVKDALEADYVIIKKGKEEAENDLAAAKPALEEAENAVKRIKPADITELKNMKKPADPIRRVLDGVLVLRQQPMEKVSTTKDKAGNLVHETSWDQSLKMMADTRFLGTLTGFPRDEMNEETIELLMPYIKNPDFLPDKVTKSSVPAGALCTWVRAMETYYNISKNVQPKMEKLRISEGKLEVAQKKLAEKEKEYQGVLSSLREIQAKFDDAMRKKKELQDDAEKTKRFMEQANNLINALGGERERWTKQSNEFKSEMERLVGDGALAAAFISYCGPYNSEFRKLLLNEYFYKDCVARQIPVTKDLIVTKMLTDEQQIGEWNIEGLPSDDHSVQNAIMVTKSTKWPLLIDPQGQGLAWLKKRMELKKLKYKISRFSDRKFRNYLEDCMTFGNPLLIENVDEEIDPMMDPVLEKQIISQGRSKQIIVADKAIDYDDGFLLYLCTKLPNPRFSPELCAKTTLIDFTVTMSGLEQQLLGAVIQKEKKQLEEEREKLLQDVNHNQKHIKKLEDELLAKLSSAKGNLLEDEELVRVLSQTKKAAREVEEKLRIAVENEKRISVAREEYRPVATRGSVLYFLIVEMSLVNPMYQTSLTQFQFLFDRSMDNSEKAPVAAKRISNIIEYCTFSIYQYISRGLFKRHKFLFVFLLACKILLREGKMTYEQFSVLLKGGAALDINTAPKKVCDWIPDNSWLNVCSLTVLENFVELPDLLAKQDKLWNKWFNEEKPELAKVPQIHEKLSKFEILLLVRALREDRTMLAADEFIKATLDPKYSETVGVNLEDTFTESTNMIPLVCLLSPGSDPTSMIEQLAKKYKREVLSISMGQGQEERSLQYIMSGFENGSWVLLQNCHLGLNFIGTIEDLIKEQSELDKNIHPDFRIWLTCEPNPRFPIGLLQMSIKLTLEGDVGIKAQMKSGFQWVTQDLLDSSKRPEWKPMIYTVCFMSGIVQERRKFGPLGFNIPYEFNYADLTASLSFLQNHFTTIGDDPKKGQQISWETVRYMICEVHYGGKITDDFDRRLFKSFGEKFLSSKVIAPDFAFDEKKVYKIPTGDDRKSYVEYIGAIPVVDPPTVFGLHPNADISYRTDQSLDVLATILDIQPKDSGATGGETREQKVVKIADDLLARLPQDFNMDTVDEYIAKYKASLDPKQVKVQEPLTVFLKQEIERLQKLISMVRKTLKELKLAIDGTIIMSADLINALDALFDARIPNRWLKISWDSPTLGLWYAELLKRHEQLYQWLTDKRPKTFWLTGFYNPQGFLTAVKQEVTRKHANWALDDVKLKTTVTVQNKEDFTPTSDEGVFIHGLFIEGAGWDKKAAKLEESKPKTLYQKMPVVHISAQEKGEKKPATKKAFYECPVYRTKKRTDYNFITIVELNSGEKEPAHWIRRGVCLLLKKD